MYEGAYKIVLVGVGGFAGAVLRYLGTGWAQSLSGSIGFPYGTLAVNMTGCLIIGVLSYLADVRGAFSPDTRIFLFFGLLGGFTTFSTFGNETMNLFRQGENAAALANVGSHVVIGLFFVWLGRAAAQLIWR
jgi:fluoride exporter